MVGQLLVVMSPFEPRTPQSLGPSVTRIVVPPLTCSPAVVVASVAVVPQAPQPLTLLQGRERRLMVTGPSVAVEAAGAKRACACAVVITGSRHALASNGLVVPEDGSVGIEPSLLPTVTVFDS